MKNFTTFVVVLSLTSCVPVLVVGGGAISTVAMRNRNGVSGTVSDNVIHGNVLSILSRISLLKSIEVSVKHSRVLLIGYVENEEQKRIAVEEAAKARGVSEIIDELKIGHKETLERSATDTTITSRIKAAMLFDGNVHCLNFNITTYDGVVYLLGVAETQLENDIVVNVARTTSGVTKVVSYINVVANKTR